MCECVEAEACQWEWEFLIIILALRCEVTNARAHVCMWEGGREGGREREGEGGREREGGREGGMEWRERLYVDTII